jgi:hypothetical protein
MTAFVSITSFFNDIEFIPLNIAVMMISYYSDEVDEKLDTMQQLDIK